MAIHDWTRVEAGIFHDFHTVWMGHIRSALNEGLLPKGYYALTEQHAGRIPDELGALVKLPGVGRKTANVVLGNAYGKNEGVVVDTHVARVAGRLGLTKEIDPIKIEQDLIRLFPRDRWTMLAHLLIEHGRTICVARRPKCEICFLNDICPSSLV